MSGLSDQEEQALLQSIAGGDSDALRHLHDRMARSLYSQALKILSNRTEAEEVVQDVFLSIWRNAGNFDIDKAKPFTWASMLTRNRCIDKIREKKRRIPTAEAHAGPEERILEMIDGKTAADKLVSDERDNQIRLAIDQLPADQRAAIRLAFYKGMTHIQIARTLNTSLGTTKSRIRYGFEKLGKQLHNL